MSNPLKSFLILNLLFMTSTLSNSLQKQASDSRYVKADTLISETLPPIRILVDSAFEYVGKNKFVLKNIADVERFHFVDVKDGHIERMFVVQFEDVLDGVDFTYKYSYPEPVMLAGERYRHNTWFFNNAENVQNHPGAEMDHTLQLLAREGLVLQDELMMSRFVRDYGPERRNEIILFYFENLSSTGFFVRDFEEGGKAREKYESVSAALTERSLKAFTILE